MSCAFACEVMFIQPSATISLLILLDSRKLHHKYPLRLHLTLYWPCIIIMHLVFMYCMYTSCMHCSCTTRGDTCSFFPYPSMVFPISASLAWKALLGRRVSQIYNRCSWAQTLCKSGPPRLDICIPYIEMQLTCHLHLQFWAPSNGNVAFKYGIYPYQMDIQPVISRQEG